MTFEDRLLPNIWAEGQLFDFSGVDGQTDFDRPATATTLADRAGFVFHTRLFDDPAQDAKTLSIAVKVRGKLYDAPPKFGRLIVCSDLIDVPLFEDGNASVRVAYVYWKHASILGRISVEGINSDEVQAYAYISSRAARQIEVTGDLLTVSSEKETAVLRSRFKDYGVHEAQAKVAWVEFDLEEGSAEFEFIIGMSDEVFDWHPFDFDGEYRKKLAFFDGLPVPPNADEGALRTFRKACSTLKANVYSPRGEIPFHWTTPDKWPHRHMWLWDSAFQSIGYKYISHSLGEECIQSILCAQAPDGYIPLATNHGFPHLRDSGPAMCNGVRLTQPPTLAWAAWNVYRTTRNRDFLAYCLPRLKSFMRWLFANRDSNNNGLLEWQTFDSAYCPCGESGMDNSPRFFGGRRLDSIDLNAFAVKEIRCMEMMAAELDEQPDMELSDRRETATRLVNDLMWDDRDGFYYDLMMDGQLQKIKSISSFFTMTAGIPDRRRAERLVEHLTNPEEFWSDPPVRTLAANEPTFDRNMWRGPVWINCNYLVMDGLRQYGYDDLADEISAKTIDEITRWYLREGSVYEFYHDQGLSPTTLARKDRRADNPLGRVLRDYGWTCALYVDLLMSAK